MHENTTSEWEDLQNKMHAPALLVDTNQWCVLKIANNSALTGLTLEVGQSLSEIFGDKLLKKIKEGLKGKEFFSVDVRIKNSTGQWHGQVKVTELKHQTSLVTFLRPNKENVKGNLEGFELEALRQRANVAEELNSILRLEIQDHEHTQGKLMRAEKYAKTIIDSSMNIIVAVDNNGIIRELNRNVENVLGFEKSEKLEKHIHEILKEGKDYDRILKGLKSNDFIREELTFSTADGSDKKLFVSVSSLLEQNGERLGTLWSMRDLTALKHSEEVLASTTADYADLFENASDLIQGLSGDGKLIYANKAWKNKLGYSDEEIENLCFYEIVDEIDRAEYRNYLEGILKGKKLKTKVWRLISKTGDCILVESNDNLKLQNVHQPMVRSIMRDVTESVAAEKRAKEEQAKIQAIFNSGEHMFWTVNENTALTSFNEKYKECIYQIYGEYPEINKDKRTPKKKFASEEYHQFWALKYKEVFDTGRSVYFQTRTTSKAGQEQYREVFLNPIFDTDQEKKVNEVAGMAIDISDKKHAERMLNEQSKKIKTIFNAAQHMIWSVGCDMNLTSFNDFFVRKHQERFGIETVAGMKISDLYKRRNATAREALIAQYERALLGEKLQFELGFYDNRGQLHTEEFFLSPIYNDAGEVSEIAGISQTVTFKRTAERKLKDQAAKINAIFDSTAMLIWTVDKKLRMVSYNKVFAQQHFKLLGNEVSIGDEFSKSLKGAIKDDGMADLKGYFNEAFKGNKQQFEGVVFGVDGKKRWMETFLNPIYLEDDEVKEISCLSYEITDKKLIEEQMLESIREKEILLQEVHHRVKNNLQVISSILNLQSAYVKDQNSLDILRESQNRIKSMSFIHESLYQTRDFSQIEFSDYILSLSNNLIHSYSIQAGKIELETNFKKVFLSLDQAIPCGLIINELVSNALKYAYPHQESGVIRLVIREEGGKVQISVGDSGVGLPAGLDVENSESLGLQLVYTLIDQLDASIQIDTKMGTEYLITFDKL